MRLKGRFSEVNLRRVREPHYLCESKFPGHRILDADLEEIWDERFIEAECAICAIRKKRIIGFLRYTIDEKTLIACGTWVLKKYRRKGLADKIWSYVLSRETKINEISITHASKVGERFITYLKATYGDQIKFTGE